MICGHNDIPVLFRQTVVRAALPAATRQAPLSSRFRNRLRVEKFDAVFLLFLYLSYFVNLLLFFLFSHENILRSLSAVVVLKSRPLTQKIQSSWSTEAGNGIWFSVFYSFSK